MLDRGRQLREQSQQRRLQVPVPAMSVSTGPARKRESGRHSILGVRLAVRPDASGY